MPFQINSKILFLTYPECNVNKKDLYEHFEKFNPAPTQILVAKEKHKNGNSHLHAFLKFHEPFRTKDPKFADFKGFHGNYQGARSAKNVVKYCTKEDNYIANFDLEELLLQKKPEKEILGKRLLEGEELVKIVQENPKLLFGYQRLKNDLQFYIKDVEESKIELDLPAEVPNPWGLRLEVDTDRKQCHYWFYSSIPSRGKTTGVIMPLIKDHQAVLLNPKGTYHAVTRSTRIIVLDELKCKKMSGDTMNALCDGLFEFRRFMEGQFLLKEKALIVVCSNYSIESVFPLEFHLVKTRFIEICCDDLKFSI